jgi:hypothetical protein
MSDAATPHQLGVDPRFQNRERQPGLDLLRALAIIVVVVYHAALFGFKLPGRVDRFGWIGVDLFFVLSGYLIGGQLLAPLGRGQAINLGRFFTRRALRIMPAYFAVLAIYFLLPSWREYSEMSQPEISVVGAKHRALVAEPLCRMPGRSRLKTNSISRYLFFCSFSFAVRARPSSFHA